MTEPNKLMAEVLPHPGSSNLRLVNALCRRGAALKKEYENRSVVPVVFTTPSEDRHGSAFKPDGWQLEPFKRNPVVDWAHLSKFPLIGNARELTMDRSGEWVADLDFALDEWSDYGGPNFARLIYNLMEKDRLRGVSHSFIPKKMSRRDATTIPRSLAENVLYEEMELTAITVCNVPSNRDALARSIADGFATENEIVTLSQMGLITLTPDDSIIVIGSSRETPKVETRDITVVSDRTVESFRGELATILQRCCGCEPYREPKPEAFTEEQKAADVMAMTSTAKAQLATMEAALTGWRTTSQNVVRSMFSSMAVSAMYSIEGLIWRAKEFYGVNLVIDVPSYSADDLERAAKDAEPTALSRMPIPRQREVLVVTDEARDSVRAKFTELLRCSGYEPTSNNAPKLTEDPAKRAAEIEALRELADVVMDLVETAMRGWKAAESDGVRALLVGRVADAMWVYEACVSWLGYYGEKVESLPAVDVTEVARALEGFTRAGAVFSKKNLAKIDQLIEIANDLRAAANKPTAEDLPAEERGIKPHERIAGPFEFASTQVNIAGDAAESILELGAKIPDDALAEKGRETDVHATIKFGIDKAVTADAMREVIDNSDSAKEMAQRGGTMTLGVTAIFDADEAYDVVYISVESEDLVLLNHIISEAVPVTDTKPEYVPHVTLAYVKKGEGQKYAGDETLVGTTVTFNAIVFSDTEGNETELPLSAASQSADDRGVRGIRIIKSTGDVARERVTGSQSIRLLAPDTARGRSVDSPAPERSIYVKLLSE